MHNPKRTQTGAITETIRGIVDRVTYHNPDNAWSVLRVLAFNNLHQQETVIVHQTKVFAGATMEFQGAWIKHRRNNYDLGVFNGGIGVIQEIDNEELTCVISFLPDQRIVEYERDDISELDLSYAITIHKSQGSEFGAIIIPVLTQHF